MGFFTYHHSGGRLHPHVCTGPLLLASLAFPHAAPWDHFPNKLPAQDLCLRLCFEGNPS